jgi:hypothetical protein
MFSSETAQSRNALIDIFTLFFTHTNAIVYDVTTPRTSNRRYIIRIDDIVNIYNCRYGIIRIHIQCTRLYIIILYYMIWFLRDSI